MLKLDLYPAGTPRARTAWQRKRRYNALNQVSHEAVGLGIPREPYIPGVPDRKLDLEW